MEGGRTGPAGAKGTGLPTARGEGRREGRRKVVGDGRLGTSVVDIERVKVWSYRQGTRALRQIAERVGAKAKLHSLRIGSATVLAAGEVNERVVHREGRWKSSEVYPKCCCMR